MIKRIMVCFAVTVAVTVSFAQELKPVTLNAPDTSRKMTLMQALKKRGSVREFGEKNVAIGELSDLLWAANGINRPEKGGRTASSAINAKDIDIYVITREGAYLYDPAKSLLNPVAAGDFRKQIGGQDYVATAPVNLILVSDLSRFTRGDDAGKSTWAAFDAGIVSQNISLFCASVGLGTVPRAMIDFDKLKKVLKLNVNQRIMLNHPVGYGK
jgi:SagB-type dehydrogenase family enzyme